MMSWIDLIVELILISGNAYLLGCCYEF
jgi:hypothetical protein